MDCKLLSNRQRSVWSDDPADAARWWRRHFKAASPQSGVCLTFRIGGRSGGLERRRPFPKLLPGRSLYLQASLTERPTSTEKQALPFYTLPPLHLHERRQSRGGNICPPSPQSTPSLHRQAQGETEEGDKMKVVDVKGRKSAWIHFISDGWGAVGAEKNGKKCIRDREETLLTQIN